MMFPPRFARIKILIPVLFLVFATTAVPIEVRAPGNVRLSVDFDDIPDIVVNVLFYVAVGVALVELGPLRAIVTATLISAFAETSQFVMMYRDPSLTDVLANAEGAALGVLVSARFKIKPFLQIGRWRGLMAAVFLAATIIHLVKLSDRPENPDGSTSSGRMEGHWKLTRVNGQEVSDDSGHGLAGKFRKQPPLEATGPSGGAAVFDGTNYISLGNTEALRFAGSMTITAWVNSSRYPFDDAAIVSQLRGDRGYQLDTTIDRGPRTIGFKLTDSCGELMARYGRTPLVLNTWYHVAGVYNAQARTIDVYLDGKPDNGFLLGSVSRTQRSARGITYMGRRGDSERYSFSGSIAEVRIYSFALTQSQIAADMNGDRVDPPADQQKIAPLRCGPISEPDDKEIPGDSGLLGILAAVAVIGLRPSARWPFILIASLTAGLVVVAVSASNLPAFNTWMLPLVSLAGGASIAVSVQPHAARDH